jgi:NAD+ diphosphatase
VDRPERSRQNLFGTQPFDRIAHRRDDAEWLAGTAASADARFLVLDSELRALSTPSGTALRTLGSSERVEMFPDSVPALLGESEGTTYFAIRAEPMSTAGVVGEWQGLREIGLSLDPLHASLFAYARGLLHWQTTTRYCSRCGNALTLIGAGHRGECSQCRALHFPRTDPAIIVIVEHEGACLLGRQASWPAGRYSTLAGFVEPGETLEDAVRREVEEETGVRVVEAEYHSSQPWPFPGSLMVAFTAVASGRDIRLGDGELEHAKWVTPEALVQGIRDRTLLLPPAISVSFRLIEHWLAERAGIVLAEVVPPA